MVGRQAPKLTCGDNRDLYEDCSNTPGHDRKYYHHNCRDMRCRVCSRPGAYKLAYKNYERLKGISLEYYKAGYDLGDLVHVWLSPPRHLYYKFATKNSYDSLNRMALALYSQIGAITGSVVLHNKRGNPEKIKAYQKHQIDLPDSWHWHNVCFMPNGHLIKSDDFNAMTAEPDDKRGPNGGYSTGWTYGVINEYTKGGMMNALAYEIKHAAMFQSGENSSKVVRLYGLASYNSAKTELSIRKIQKTCGTCGCDKSVYRDEMFVCDACKKEITRRFIVSNDKLYRIARQFSLTAGLVRTEDLSCIEKNESVGAMFTES